MCGIVGYIGVEKAVPILLDGLHRLEYRGYDSAGIAILEKGRLEVVKRVGKVENLVNALKGLPLDSNVGIAHTRWATHGTVSEENSHPHTDCTGKIAVVHNGIIENHFELKRALEQRGHRFRPMTDTEVLVHLIEEECRVGMPFEEAVRRALVYVVGTYGIAVLSADESDKIVVAKKGSPLLLGINGVETIVASDASAVLARTRNVVFMDEGDVAVLTPKGHKIMGLDGKHLQRDSTELDWTIEQAQKNGHEHFMLKEICEQPETIENVTRGRVMTDSGAARLGGLLAIEDRLRAVERIVVVACGTSLHAGMLGKYLIKKLAGIPVEVEVASEFRYDEFIPSKNSVLLVISQSGETADTKAALEEAQRKGVLTLGVVNVVGSTIARLTDAGVYLHAGPEIAVASTKAFTAQVVALGLLAVYLGRQRGMSALAGKEILERLLEIPKAVSQMIRNENWMRQIASLARKYSDFKNFLFLGRKYHYPVALEGALKLKEISYIHAEGQAAGEMKHGTIALITPEFATMFLAPRDGMYEKSLSNLQEIRARKGTVIAITTEGNTEIVERSLADDVVYIPSVADELQPIVTVVPLQLFAYYMAIELGFDPDHPRNLAKSVTVE